MDASGYLGVHSISHHGLRSPATSEPIVLATHAFPCYRSSEDALTLPSEGLDSGLQPVPYYNLAVLKLCNWVSGKHFSFIQAAHILHVGTETTESAEMLK